MKTNLAGTAIVTGASYGIGAIYADRLARRGYDLILVARSRERLEALASRITDETGRSAEIMVADLNESAQLAHVESVLRTNPNITLLVNNAGMGAPQSLVDSEIDTLESMIHLNVTALMRLTRALVPAYLERGGGSIINISSIAGIAPELLNGVYGGTKAFVLAFSLSLQREFSANGIYVQAVLPGVTATDFWSHLGSTLERVPEQLVMKADEMVDAALAGFDQRELITLPALQDIADWQVYESARQNMIPKLSLRSPAKRYGALPA